MSTWMRFRRLGEGGMVTWMRFRRLRRPSILEIANWRINPQLHMAFNKIKSIKCKFLRKVIKDKDHNSTEIILDNNKFNLKVRTCTVTNNNLLIFNILNLLLCINNKRLAYYLNKSSNCNKEDLTHTNVLLDPITKFQFIYNRAAM